MQKLLRRVASTVPVWLLLLAAAFVVVWRSGALQRGVAGFPDEPAHYVTSIAIRTYFLEAAGRNPIRFLEDYYLHYPMVAIGKWPPVYYVANVLWSIPFGCSIASLIVLNAVVSAGVGILLFTALRPSLGSLPSFGAALAWLLFPATQWCSVRVMADCFLSLFALGSLLALAQYFGDGRRRWLAAYAGCACLAILTKGSGFAIIALPVLAALIARRRDWLLDLRLHAATAAVLALVMPWHLYVRHMLPLGIAPGGFSLNNLLHHLQTLASGFSAWLGPATLVSGIAGLWLVVAAGPDQPNSRHQPFWACQLAALISFLAIYVVIPMSMEPRRTLMAAPAIAALAMVPVWQLWQRSAPLLAAGLFLVILLPLARMPHWVTKPEGPWRSFVRSQMMPRIPPGSAVLIAGRVAEGAVIGEYAQVEPVPKVFLLRASKHIVESDWMGVDYRLRIPDPVLLDRFLQEIPVNWIVLESGFDSVFLPTPDSVHLDIVRGMLHRQGSGWIRVAQTKSPAGSPHAGFLELYQRANPVTRPVRLEVDMTRSLGKVLRREHQ